MAEEMALVSKAGEPLLSTKELTGARVIEANKEKPVGRVHCFVFHPRKRVCMGFLIKRPDAALMFHRKDTFVSLDGFTVGENKVSLKEGDAFFGAAACRRLGIDLDECVIWQGMPLMGNDGRDLGMVDDVAFSAKTGRVEWVVPRKSAAAKALLGEMVVPRDYVVGFKTGMGAELTITEGQGDAEREVCGAIIVDEKAFSIASEGGLAEKAGRTSAIASDKARRMKESVKVEASAAAKKTGKAVDRGAYATGRQLGMAKGMFAAFKREYDKAVSDESKRTEK